jgi:hypothetical protein
MWKLQIGHETLGRLKQGELFCRVCGAAIASPPPVMGFFKADRSSLLVGFSVCELCFQTAGTLERLAEMVAKAVGGTAAPPPLSS